MPSLEVIGAGFGRTGTYSLYLALNKLGYNTMHGFTIGRDATLDVTVWENAKDHPGTDWNKVYGGVNGVNAAVDHPTCDFATELSEFYPDAKVILTVRSPESWLKSMRKTIGYSYSTIEMPQSHLGDVGRMLQKTTYFGMIGFDCSFEDDNYMCEYFTRHNQRIIDSISSDRLLIMNLGDGWEPLCKFLGKPIPDEPYPMTNSSDEFVENLAEYLRNGQQVKAEGGGTDGKA